MRLMQRLARWHIWLGWIVALPILLWLVSGLVMSLKPLEETRGEHLRRAPVPVDGAGLVAPKATGQIGKIALINQPGRAVWIVTGADKSVHRFDARSGEPLGPVDEAEARRIVAATYAGSETLIAMKEFAAHAAPGAALMFTSGPSHGIALGSFAGETLFHASLDPAEYRALLAAQGFAVVDHVAEDPSCGGRTVWLARRV